MPQPEAPIIPAEKPSIPAQRRDSKVTRQARIVNSEPDSKLYVFGRHNYTAANSREIHKSADDKKRRLAQASTKKDIDKKKIHPIKKLKRKFRKNGLGAADAGFNARFVYYIWKTQESKKPGKFAVYIAVMTAFAKIYGTLADLFAPLLALMGWLLKPEAGRSRFRPLKYAADWLAPAGAIAFTALAIIYISAYRPELELWVNGERIGLVESRDVVINASSRTELNMSAILGESYEFSGTISYRVVLVSNPQFLTEREVFRTLHGYSQNYIVSAYGLYIDGALVGVTTDESYIDEALERILGEITDENINEVVEFANEIEIARSDHAMTDVMPGEDFINIITYSVAAALEGPAAPPAAYGESDEHTADIASVAAVGGLGGEAVNVFPRGGVGALAAVNDNSLLARLSRSSANASAVQLRRTRIESYYIEVPFGTRRVNSGEHFVGTEIVQSIGANGVNRRTIEISLMGEIEVSRETLSNEVLAAPAERVIIVGTRERPRRAATGSFIRPMRGGTESMQFGGSHRGLDIAAPRGTSVMAADGGTVTFAGFNSSYGNYIIISHGSVYSTLYAHLSAMNVRRGDQVYRGQEIGRVGSTGNSTGPHLHFEIIRNGTPVNPKIYIP